MENQVLTPGCIKMALTQESDAGIRIKLLCLVQLYEGKNYRDVAALFQVSLGSLSKWKKQVEKEGLKGLQPRYRAAKKPKLSETQQAELCFWVANLSPESFGFNTAVWTAPILQDIIEKKWGVQVSKDTIYNYLKKKGSRTVKQNPVMKM